MREAKGIISELVREDKNEKVIRLKNLIVAKNKTFLVHILENSVSYCDFLFRNLPIRAICKSDLDKKTMKVLVKSANNKIELKLDLNSHSAKIENNWNQILYNVIHWQLPKLYKENPCNFKYNVF